MAEILGSAIALQMLFGGLDPFAIAERYRGFAHLDPAGAEARRFVALEDWLNDGVPLPAPVARECLGDWYGQNTPARLQWRVAGEAGEGVILNYSSMNAYRPLTNIAAYSAAKGAIVSLTRSIASDCADHSICCNAIAPGYMDTEMCANMTQERKDECTKRIPAGRWGLPEDMKGPVVFLASAASDYLNGALIPVDGGYLVK